MMTIVKNKTPTYVSLLLYSIFDDCRIHLQELTNRNFLYSCKGGEL